MKDDRKILQTANRKKISDLKQAREKAHQAELEAAATRLMASDIFKNMPGFTVPAQARTRLKTASMIATAAFMLESESFSEISIERIAEKAKCSIPSIYARFRNKEALLPAVHLLTIEETRKRLDEEIYFDRFCNKTVDLFYEVIIGIIFDYFEANRNFVRAAILGEAIVVHLQLEALLPIFAARLNLILPRLLKCDTSEIEGRILFGLGLIMSLLRDAAVVPPAARTRGRATLVRMFAMVIETGMTG